MSSKIIKKYLETLSKKEIFDKKYIALLLNSNELNEGGEVTVSKVLDLIEKRYAENKKNKT